VNSARDMDAAPDTLTSTAVAEPSGLGVAVALTLVSCALERWWWW
jgi:hypothetical protein